MNSHRHRKTSSHPRCAWTSNGWTCCYRAMEVLVNGTKVCCRFCQVHQCGRNENAAPCSVATIPGYRFCQNRGFCLIFPLCFATYLPHYTWWGDSEGEDGTGLMTADSRCTAIEEAGRCGNYVKGMEANKYRYCSQLRTSPRSPYCISARVSAPPALQLRLTRENTQITARPKAAKPSAQHTQTLSSTSATARPTAARSPPAAARSSPRAPTAQRTRVPTRAARQPWRAATSRCPYATATGTLCARPRAASACATPVRAAPWRPTAGRTTAAPRAA